MRFKKTPYVSISDVFVDLLSTIAKCECRISGSRVRVSADSSLSEMKAFKNFTCYIIVIKTHWKNFKKIYYHKKIG